MLSRIDFLEKQNLNSKLASSEESAKAIVNSLREEKLKIEVSAKEAIEKIIVEKNALAQQLDELRAVYTNLSEEHSQMCKVNEDNCAKILGLAERNQELTVKLETSENELAELNKKQTESIAALDANKASSEKLVQELNEKTDNLSAQVCFKNFHFNIFI